MTNEQCFAQNIARHRGRLLFFLLDAGNLNLFFARNRALRHGGVKQNIGEKVDCKFQVRLGNVHRNAKTVIPGFA